MGTCKMRNEIEPNRNETKRNEINRNEIHRNETKRFYFVSFRFRFVSVNFVSFRWISFRFRFAFYRYSYISDVSMILNQTDIIFTSFHIISSFYFIFSQSKNWITNPLHVFNPTKLQRELPFNLKMSFFSIKFSDSEAWKKKGINQK